MSIVDSLISAEVFVGVVAASAGLGGVWLTQQLNDRRRAADDKAAERARVEGIALELFDAVTELHLWHREYVPRWNSWPPKLATVGAVFLEYAAGRAAVGHEHGAAQVARTVMSHQASELAAVAGFRAPLLRVAAATNRLALLTDSAVRTAAFRLGEAAARAGEVYSRDNLWRPKRAAAARELADTELYAAIEKLHEVLRSWQRPAPRRTRWWSRRSRKRSTATAMGSSSSTGATS